MAKKTKEEWKSRHNVFDAFTNRLIFKLITQGHIDGLESPISIGKEANVFSAKKGNKRLIAKIYRLETCDFNRMYDYIKYDQRYINLRGKKRKIIFAWVQREFRNLLIARQLGVRVPTPHTVMGNIILMEMIGDPAPKLKDSYPRAPRRFYDAMIASIEKMKKGGMVHADLSPFNILIHKDMPVFIDFSQTTDMKNPRAMEYFERDLSIVNKFFRKNGLKIQ